MTLDRMIIRPATLGEIDRVSDIINDPPSPAVLALAGSVERAVRGGRVLSRAGLSLQLENTVIAEIDGQIVGIMDASASHKDPKVTPGLVLRTLPSLLGAAGPAAVYRMLSTRPMYARVGFDNDLDSYYVAELDVDADYRNRGIGGALLDHGERCAREQGCPRMTLTTTTTNPAQHLYERHGFRIAATKLDAAYERFTGNAGRVLMVKVLV